MNETINAIGLPIQFFLQRDHSAADLLRTLVRPAKKCVLQIGYLDPRTSVGSPSFKLVEPR